MIEVKCPACGQLLEDGDYCGECREFWSKDDLMEWQDEEDSR